jgi:ribokinase
MYDVITVGSSFYDILVKSRSFKLMKSELFSSGVAICEAYGGKVEADDIKFSTGGGGTNSAVSFARKRLKVAIISEMGTDLPAKMIRAELIREGVDTQYLVAEEGEQTAVSVILLNGEGDRSVISFRGASRMLTSKDIPWTKLKTRWFYISSLGGRISLLEDLCIWAKRHEVKVALNPGKDEIQYKERLQKVFNSVEILIVNQEEAHKITGREYKISNDLKSSVPIKGPKISIITAGKDGGLVFNEGAWQAYKSLPAKAQSSLGAGDAFGSGFVAACAYGHSLQDAIIWGAKNARSVVEYLSAKEGLLYLSQIE